MKESQAQDYRKTRVLQLVGDSSFGGIKSTVDALVNSELGKEFEFNVSSLDTKKTTKSLHLRPDVIMCSQASHLRGLPKLVLLKQQNPHTKIIIREHHYSAGYEQCQVSWATQFHLMLKLNYGLADRVVAVSQAQSEWMLKNSLVSPKKLIVIQQCTILKDLLNIGAKSIEHPLVLAAYGRVKLQKGFDILLQAMKLVSHLPVKLHIGGEGPQLEELKQFAQGQENIEFVGRVDNVPKFLKTSDVVVIPSRWEPWGNVCLEAKAAGKPVIASDVDGLTEQVQNCGLLIPSGNPKALVGAIEHFVSLPQTQLHTWGRNGRKLVRGAWERYLTQWRTLLREVSKE